ncbi:MAG: DUF3849 domain-containing protein [Lachnospiraceae bacterium]|nr:DUF3849 domain-containing protein [Lachnospiraceae bacterium]
MYAVYPIYYPSAKYARDKGEIELWRESFNINKECRDFINEKASIAHYERNLAGFAQELADNFGIERSIFVMARFIIRADWDKRYDDEVKARAKLVDFQDMKEWRTFLDSGQDSHKLADHTQSLYSDVHPCILNCIFRNLMKREQEQVNLPSPDNEQENELDEGVEL